MIDERKKGDFKSFQDIRERIPSLHDPAKVIAHRIEVELKDDFIKYRLFTTPSRRQRPIWTMKYLFKKILSDFLF